VIKEQPSHDVLVTTVIYRADKFGRVKMEQYTQTRLADGQITLDYSEHYETHPERVTHRDVLDAHPEVSAAESQPPQVVVTSSAGEQEQSKHSDSQTDADKEEGTDGLSDADGKEELTEEEKKGLCLHIFEYKYFILSFTFLSFFCSCLTHMYSYQ